MSNFHGFPGATPSGVELSPAVAKPPALASAGVSSRRATAIGNDSSERRTATPSRSAVSRLLHRALAPGSRRRRGRRRVPPPARDAARCFPSRHRRERRPGGPLRRQLRRGAEDEAAAIVAELSLEQVMDSLQRDLRMIDRRYKVEGVQATIDTGVMDFLFVCDQDDPEQPSPLLAAAMPVDGRTSAAAESRSVAAAWS